MAEPIRRKIVHNSVPSVNVVNVPTGRIEGSASTRPSNRPNQAKRVYTGASDVQQANRPNRDKHVYKAVGGITRRTAEYLAKYIALPESSVLVTATWVIAAHLMDLWDKFPHLAITSPEKRCGKTTLLDLLYQIVPNPRYTTNISPAALYRVIEAERPSLLMDESQSISRRGSEASEVIREILNAGIGKTAKVTRCVGQSHEIGEFSVYSPKVFAMIGQPDSVLADRCLPVDLKRKTRDDQVERYRSRIVEPEGQELREQITKWGEEHSARVQQTYDTLEPFDIDNDRKAELLMPLQSILSVDDEALLAPLLYYAEGLDVRDREAEMQSPGVRLLLACREIFDQREKDFVQTIFLISDLVARTEEPWGTYNNGKEITPEKLAHLLKPYAIRSQLMQKWANNKNTGIRGYYRHTFEEAWRLYLPSERTHVCKRA